MRLSFRSFKNQCAAEADKRAGYNAYRLRFCLKYAYVLLIAAIVMNLCFLAPDSLFIASGARRLVVATARGAFLLLMLLIGICLRRVQTFHAFSLIVTVSEIACFAVHLLALHHYERHAFLMHMLLLVIGTLVVFEIPNRFCCKLAVSLSACAAFFVLAAKGAYAATRAEYAFALGCMAVIVALCAEAAYRMDKRRFTEFLAKERLEYASSTDYLTDTANRSRLNQEAERWIGFCQRQRMPLSLVFIDVDNLKDVNDRFGHEVGDTVLVDLARNVKKKLRSSDLLARWGGDEFVLLLPNAALENAIALAGRIKDALLEGKFASGIRVTCSFGIVEMREGASFQDLIREADALMYDGKRCGKGVVRYTPRTTDVPRRYASARGGTIEG